MAPDTSAEEYQTREERLEVARRYRERRGRELRELAQTAVDGEVEAAGEFSAVPTESLAAVPVVGMLMLPMARRKARKLGLSPKLLLALDAEHLHALELQPTDMRRDHAEASEMHSWPRAEVSIERAGRALMRDKVLLHVPDRDEPITLFAPSLTTNPWSAEVVRLLGGEAPEPLDLSLEGPGA
ncbi:MAG: hypothetical protein KDB58_01790 [Solirubrobacterales bacterium]|nr:hypothetical protein [Solirubrobacterales bacterium]MCB8969834.1 hypothetical protein [Thermoleophilales bacterium]MCO5328424.1 hypothetical protein [Solirubrobacterales bacterium]